MNSSITNSIAVSPSISDSMLRKREGILPDYTRQGKSTMPSRWSTVEKIVHKSVHLPMKEQHNFGNNSIQSSLDSSDRMSDSTNATLDGKILDECQDRNEFIDFYLKIPPKEFRLQRENSNERLHCCINLNKKTTKKKKGKSIIDRLLSNVDDKMLSNSFQINVIQCRKSNRSLSSEESCSKFKEIEAS